MFLTAVIEAVDEYQELLRMSVATAGNDHRLGANEAPPAIISIFLGDELGAIVEAIIDGNEYHRPRGDARSTWALHVASEASRRTTPTATARAPSPSRATSSNSACPALTVNLSDCNMILNTAVAKSSEELRRCRLKERRCRLRKAGAVAYIKKTLTDHQRIIFNGNGYSEEWEKEAEKRGLANHRNTAEALPCFVDQKSLDLFNEFNVLTEPEARSRYEVKLDKYNKLLNIEARTMIRMVRRAYLPAITDYMADLASNITTVKAAISGADMTEAESVLEVIIAGADKAAKATRELLKVHNAAEAIEAPQEQANAYANEVIPAMDALRAEIDALECVVERDYWPVPTYNDILFYA